MEELSKAVFSAPSLPVLYNEGLVEGPIVITCRNEFEYLHPLLAVGVDE
jgi:hypothetical protein